MKRILYNLLILSLFVSCSDFLERVPRDVLTDEQVWTDPAAIEGNLANLYDNMQTEDFNYTVIAEAGYLSQITDEAVRCYTWGDHNLPVIPDGVVGWWGYGSVRSANEFLEKIAAAPISQSLKDAYVPEVRFIRAFYYFSMVKRYGGVPILTEAQQMTEDIGSLRVPRDKEKDVYEFIRTELDEAIRLLPESYPDKYKYRATKYAALALKSRAMLYAASIASFGQVELDGLVGIPAADKDFYWKEAKDAAYEIIKTNRYALYEKEADKATNFQNLFLDEDLHSEAIFVKAFKSPDKTHSFDFYNAPISFRVDYGCVTNPTLEIVEDYEYIDGSKGTLKIEDAGGNPIYYANPQDLFKDKDPRMHATIMTPFMPWQESFVEIRKGIIDGDQIKLSSNLTDTYGSGANSITITGKDGPLDTWDPTKTGFYIKKFMNPKERVPYARSENNWMVFRYAEVLLNYAEACVELGTDTGLALEKLNEIRGRAGIKQLTQIDRESVRKERKVELAFENHRFWDIRRWRVATDILNNYRFYALNPYLVWEEGKNPKDMKYLFRIEPAPKNTRTFLPKLYYERIGADQIRTNPLLVQNPFY